jgi:hypothetical protein
MVKPNLKIKEPIEEKRSIDDKESDKEFEKILEDLKKLDEGVPPRSEKDYM